MHVYGEASDYTDLRRGAGDGTRRSRSQVSTLGIVHTSSLLSSLIAYYQYLVAVSFVSSKGGSYAHILFQLD